MADRDKAYIGSPLSDQNYQDKHQNDGPADDQEGNQQSGLGGAAGPGQAEVEGDPEGKQERGGHGDKNNRRGGPTL